MRASAKVEQRQGRTQRDSNRVEGSVIYHLLPLGSLILHALGSVRECVCACVCQCGEVMNE